MNITGKILKNLRLNKNITLDQLADEINEMFKISITGSMLSKWETGKANPIYDHLIRLASYYNVTTDFLLGFNQDEKLDLGNNNNNLDKNGKFRCPKKPNNIKRLVKLLEDDKITNKDVVILKDLVQVLISKKHKNLYR
ncbi:helix-turn-helix domain-containing protein [Clostridium beijerinckii]|uniref:helix-turn-helix domain-containing protein n=1 Tax=Clostridium beijerinckii TaxID=1520 RepID=UPI0014941B8D|nr:helix-turn-helix transcriptional regulator [Clostridium beijerinckii]NOW03578.1 transcriptional regulator with XRE-family HTH domain [Clostridium beijerinckii]NRT71133.1 transcriptional regulator with XRE-family HTH domain [Clostridium beijerinckii]NYC03281.1 transcriptional regulator with XRE-family HTH domain [Clostridium beijerinckii]